MQEIASTIAVIEVLETKPELIDNTNYELRTWRCNS